MLTRKTAYLYVHVTNTSLAFTAITTYIFNVHLNQVANKPILTRKY